MLNPLKYYWDSLKMISRHGILMGCVPCILLTEFANAGFNALNANQVSMDDTVMHVLILPIHSY
eukprot:SAG22_NODE_1078_length_5677_cov_5.105952_5_plen_64_part_00